MRGSQACTGSRSWHRTGCDTPQCRPQQKRKTESKKKHDFVRARRLSFDEERMGHSQSIKVDQTSLNSIADIVMP